MNSEDFISQEMSENKDFPGQTGYLLTRQVDIMYVNVKPITITMQIFSEKDLLSSSVVALENKISDLYNS
jgi:hypothetical protein